MLLFLEYVNSQITIIPIDCDYSQTATIPRIRLFLQTATTCIPILRPLLYCEQSQNIIIHMTSIIRRIQLFLCAHHDYPQNIIIHILQTAIIPTIQLFLQTAGSELKDVSRIRPFINNLTYCTRRKKLQQRYKDNIFINQFS